MNVLIDTNVLLSAALRDRLPERVVLGIAQRDDWQWIVTPTILAEYVEVLARPKFALPPETLQHWSELLELRTIDFGDPPTAVDFPRDPKDAPFLAAAIAFDADWIVTGDQDLLQLQTVGSTRIVTASEFAREFQIS